MYGWSEFLKEMRGYYKVDLDCLSDSYRTEQREYYLNTSAWAEVHPMQLLGPGTLIKSYDLNTVTLEELQVGPKSWASVMLSASGSRGVGDRGGMD
jgi:protein arginine N-methyltransferase 1